MNDLIGSRVSAATRTLGTIFLIAGIAVVLGWTASRGMGASLLAASLAIAVASALWTWHPGVVLGLLVLAAENGIPGIDLSATSQATIAPINAVGGLLVVLLLTTAIRERRRIQATPGFLASALWAAGFTLLWLIAVIRATDRGVPYTTAIAYGRDFLLFALVLPCAIAGFRRPQLIRGFVATVVVGALIAAVGEILIVVSGASLGWLVHANAIRQSEIASLSRVYAPMGDLISAVFVVSLVATLLAPKRSPSRRLASLIAPVCGLAVLLEQARAIYLSIGVALMIALGIWILFGRTTGLLPRRLLQTTVAAALTFAILAVVIPTFTRRYIQQPLVNRVGAIVSDSSAGGSDITYRLDLVPVMLHTVGSQLPIGLGFLDPQYVDFPALPNGSIRNSDVGVLQIIMTMGIIGAITYYLPLVAGLMRLARPWRFASRIEQQYGWVQCGLFAFLLSVLLGSLTLGTLFTNGGALVTATVLGLAINLRHVLQSEAEVGAADFTVDA